MAIKCSAFGCRNGYESCADLDKRITFHTFPRPRDTQVREKWIKARKGLCAVEKLALYFRDDDFVEQHCDTNSTRRNQVSSTELKKRYLKPDAVPPSVRTIYQEEMCCETKQLHQLFSSQLNWTKRAAICVRVLCFILYGCKLIKGTLELLKALFSILFFVMYTTPLSTLISSLSLNHHLYADDTQLFSHSVLVTDANILTLNSSKTEFLISGLKQQLSKIDNSSLNTTNSAHNLVFYEHLTFSDHYFLSPAILISESSAVSILTLILKQSVPYAFIVRSKLDYCNYYNLPKSQINHLQEIQNCLALARTVVKAPKSSLVTPISSDLCTGSRLMNALDITTSHSPTKFLKFLQPTISYLISFVQSACKTRSSSAVTLYSRPSVYSSLQINNRGFRYASPYLWNQLHSRLRQPHSVHSPPGSPHPAHITSSQSPPSLSPSITNDLEVHAGTNRQSEQDRRQARLLAVTSAHSGDWLHALPLSDCGRQPSIPH